MEQRSVGETFSLIQLSRPSHCLSLWISNQSAHAAVYYSNGYNTPNMDASLRIFLMSIKLRS
ncbi:MAG: hypothetical protein J6Y39_03005 [Bacteroidaceae bacterium]|nr:hypothetical protein [Bacteroidaceae bacterium]